MDKIWLKHYPKGVPAEIDVNEYKSVRDVFEESATKFATRPAFTCMGKSLTFADLDRLSAAFGVYLQANGCKKGTRVALMMPNILQYPVCLFGTLRAGCTVVNVNPLYTARELEHQLTDSGAEVIVVVENFARTVAEVVGRTKVRRVIVTSIGELLGFKGIVVDLVLRRVKKMIPAWSMPEAVRLSDALAAGRTGKLERVALAHDDIAFLQYTGGTTGVAKGAVLLHRNIVANLLQARAWLRPFLSAEREIVITPLPLYHIFSLTANCLTFMTLGGENILIPNPRDIPGFVKEMGKYKFTAITGVNTLFNALVNNPEFAKLDFSSLRMTLGGGMAVQEAVAVRWKQVTGSPLIEAYGLTETSPAATINPLDLPAYNGTIGLPISSTEITLRDDAGKDVALGQARGNLHPRSAGDGGLLEPAGRNGEGDDRRRLLHERRHRRDGRAGLREDRRPQEGHDPGLGFQRVSERDRGRCRHAPRRSGVRGGGRAGREIGRSGEALRREEGREPDRGRRAQALPRTSHRVQDAPRRGVPDGSAEDQCRQDTAAGAARRGEEGRGLGGTGLPRCLPKPSCCRTGSPRCAWFRCPPMPTSMATSSAAG